MSITSRSRFTRLALLTLLVYIPPVVSEAHAPELHEFRLVTFKKPASAPAFKLQSLDGREISLASLSGKVVLLNFWATWCPPCLKEMPSIDALYRKFRDRGFEVLAVASDEQGSKIVKPFVSKLGLSFSVGLDPTGTVAKSYGAKNLPQSFLLNRDGKVVAAAIGERDWFSKGAISYIDELLTEP